MYIMAVYIYIYVFIHLYLFIYAERGREDLLWATWSRRRLLEDLDKAPEATEPNVAVSESRPRVPLWN